MILRLIDKSSAKCFAILRVREMMEVLFFLIPLSLILAGVGLCACVWAIRSGQFDDVDSPAQRLVFDDLQEIKK